MKKIPERSALNIVPFIDIMLVLLCIVLSISSFIAQGKIEVKLPSSSSQSTLEETKSLMLEVNAQGQMYLDGKEHDLENLRSALALINKEDHVQLRIDEHSHFAVFVSLIDLLKELNHENFSIATLRKQQLAGCCNVTR